MKVFDFDNTIYDGESLLDFFLFCLSKDLSLIVYLPKGIYLMIKYKMNKLDILKIELFVQKFLDNVLDAEKYTIYINQFWKKNKKKLKQSFLEMITPDDLIITGCPNFLFDDIKSEINTNKVLYSEFDLKTNTIKHLCIGKNKAVLFNKYYNNQKIDKFYTDSMCDYPMMELSKEVYIVRKNNIKKIK